MWTSFLVRPFSKCALLAIAISLAQPGSASAIPSALAVPAQPPVLLIHGIKENARRMEPLARYLRAHGREVYTMSLTPNLGQAGLDVLAAEVADFAQKTFGPGEQFDLVGFSMGGLVCRYYLQRLGGLEHVHRFVTVSSPHAGSMLAWLLPNPGGRQMRPGSPFLRDLDRDAHRLQQVDFTSFWTPLDLVILPAKSSVVAGADCRKLWCASHFLMVFEPKCQEAIRVALE